MNYNISLESPRKKVKRVIYSKQINIDGFGRVVQERFVHVLLYMVVTRATSHSEMSELKALA